MQDEPDNSTHLDFARQHPLGHGVLQQPHDGAAQRPGTVRRVVALQECLAV